MGHVTSCVQEHGLLPAAPGAERGSHQAALQDLGPLQSHGDAVEEDEGQDHVVKELVGDDGPAEQSEPERVEHRRTRPTSEREARAEDRTDQSSAGWRGGS